MAFFESTRGVSREASADLTLNRFVVLNASGQWAVPAAGAFCNAIVQESVSSGQAAVGALPDGAFAKVEASAAIAANANVATAADGRAATAASGNQIMGQALEAATAAGETITIQYVFKGVAA